MRFTIFLPVRNGGEHFRECVSSILSQSYKGFELTVLDNASDDTSLEWLRSKNDPRVTIVESRVVLSIEGNWQRIMSMPKNEFMTIIGHDDLIDQNYLEIMDELIDKRPDASLYQTHFRLINNAGKAIRSCYPMPEVEEAGDYLASRLSFQRDSFGTGYMYRSIDYDKIGGIHSYKKLMFADDALWIQLMKNSYKATADEVCFSYRVHANSTSYAPDWRSTFEALECYLNYLKSCSTNQKIMDALETQLHDYAVFWFQWAYFSTKNDSKEREAVTLEISRFNEIIGNFLSERQKEVFDYEVKRRVFSSHAYYRWLAWRGRKWVERRLSCSMKK